MNAGEQLPEWLKTEQQKRREAEERQRQEYTKKLIDECGRFYGQAGNIFKEGVERGAAHPKGLGNVDGGAAAFLIFVLFILSQF
jgi:hypothetical protein